MLITSSFYSTNNDGGFETFASETMQLAGYSPTKQLPMFVDKIGDTSGLLDVSNMDANGQARGLFQNVELSQFLHLKVRLWLLDMA